MPGADPWRATTKECPVFGHRVATCARKNPCLAFCWRPRPDMQLRGTRKPYPVFDLEWRNGARSTHWILLLMMTNLIVFGRKWKPKLGPLTTSLRERGFPHGI